MLTRAVKRRLMLGCLTAITISLAVTSCHRHYLIGFNMTDSLDGNIFLITRGEIPSTDEIIAFRSPKTRFYPEMIFLKLVKGKSGDVLSWNDQTVMINGNPLGVAKTRSKGGLPLERTPATALKDGEFFTWTPHPDSFDSRYQDIGVVGSSRVIGRAVRLL